MLENKASISMLIPIFICAGLMSSLPNAEAVTTLRDVLVTVDQIRRKILPKIFLEIKCPSHLTVNDHPLYKNDEERHQFYRVHAIAKRICQFNNEIQQQFAQIFGDKLTRQELTKGQKTTMRQQISLFQILSMEYVKEVEEELRSHLLPGKVEEIKETVQMEFASSFGNAGLEKLQERLMEMLEMNIKDNSFSDKLKYLRELMLVIEKLQKFQAKSTYDAIHFEVGLIVAKLLGLANNVIVPALYGVFQCKTCLNSVCFSIFCFLKI